MPPGHRPALADGRVLGDCCRNCRWSQCCGSGTQFWSQRPRRLVNVVVHWSTERDARLRCLPERPWQLRAHTRPAIRSSRRSAQPGTGAAPDDLHKHLVMPLVVRLYVADTVAAWCVTTDWTRGGRQMTCEQWIEHYGRAWESAAPVRSSICSRQILCTGQAFSASPPRGATDPGFDAEEIVTFP